MYVVVSQIEVMDYDQIGADGLIGKTVIDLEDRWFDQRWQVRYTCCSTSDRPTDRTTDLEREPTKEKREHGTLGCTGNF